MKKELITIALAFVATSALVLTLTLNQVRTERNLEALVSIVDRQNDVLVSHDEAIRQLRAENDGLKYAVSQLWRAVCAPTSETPEHPELKDVCQ